LAIDIVPAILLMFESRFFVMYLYLAIHIQEVRFEFYSMGRGLYDFQLHPFIFLCPCGNILLVLKPSCCRVKSVVNKVYFLSYEGAVSGAHQLLRSEEHTSELQSRENIVCRLLLEKKNISDHHIHVN